MIFGYIQKQIPYGVLSKISCRTRGTKMSEYKKINDGWINKECSGCNVRKFCDYYKIDNKGVKSFYCKNCVKGIKKDFADKYFSERLIK